MNFKPTISKAIFSILLGLILGFFLNTPLTNAFPKIFTICAKNNFEALCYPNQLLFWIVEILAVLIIYTLWSLIQNKN
jgi:hypothetical protein